MDIRIRLVLLPALILALSIGCAKNANRSAELSGKVTYKGQPVTGGSMTLFVGEGGYPVGISPDGSYSANQLPEGEATATVTTDALSPNKPKYGGGKAGGGMSPPPEGKGGPTGTYVKIPDKYKFKDKSDLKVTLKAGKQQKDFELKD